MNQPTREEFERLEVKHNQLEAEHNQLREEVRKLKEQRTDEMKAINVNVASADVVTRLDTLEQKIDTVQEDTNRVTIQMEGARADILRIGESQADLRDRIIEHGQPLESIENKQDAQTEILGQLMNHAELHDTRFDAQDKCFDTIEAMLKELLRRGE